MSRLQYEEFATSTHAGTHMDAPAHVIEGGIYIDEISLRAFFGKVAVINITEKAALSPDAEITVEDLENWECTTQTSLNGYIVLLNSGWGHRWPDREAFFGTSTNDMTKLHFPGFSTSACKWLVENRKIRGMGTDAASLDVGTTTSFPCHKYILGSGIFILENVANVHKLPSIGSKLYAFPMKIGKGSGAPVRIVASVPVTN